MSRIEPTEDVLVDLGRLPKRDFETPLWCDFFELLCLTHPDHELSKSDILDLWSEESDIDEEVSSQEELENENEAGVLAFDLDKRSAKVDDWFRILRYRQTAFNEFYPFSVAPDQNNISRHGALTFEHKMYCFLLICSAQTYVNQKQGRRNQLTSAFERLSAEALRSWFPEQAEIHVFGTSAGANGRYQGSKIQKLKRLGEDLNAPSIWRAEDFPSTDSADGGLDIVAWVPCGDSQAGILMSFSQCACSVKEWERKQAESAPSRWRQYFHFKHDPANIVFIPLCFRDGQGDWFAAHRISSILVDRQRFLQMLTPRKHCFLDEAAAFHLIEAAISQVRSIYK